MSLPKCPRCWGGVVPDGLSGQTHEGRWFHVRCLYAWAAELAGRTS